MTETELLAILRAKLHAHVDRSGGPDACWPWTKSCTCGYGKEANTKRGYGQTGGSYVDDAGNTVRWHRLMHRAAKEVELGRVLRSEECVLHRCDNPPCCNPRHTFIGTRADNADDKMKKGRHNYRTHRGAKHGMSKVTEDQVRELRDLYARKQMTQVQLAARYSISQTNVSDIIRRRIWDHVK